MLLNLVPKIDFTHYFMSLYDWLLMAISSRLWLIHVKCYFIWIVSCRWSNHIILLLIFVAENVLLMLVISPTVQHIKFEIVMLSQENAGVEAELFSFDGLTQFMIRWLQCDNNRPRKLQVWKEIYSAWTNIPISLSICPCIISIVCWKYHHNSSIHLFR